MLYPGAAKVVETKIAHQTVKERLDSYETEHFETKHVEVKKKKKVKKSWICKKIMKSFQQNKHKK